MKKIIIFLSVLCLMVSIFTISTFAADSVIEEGAWTVSASNLAATTYPTHIQSTGGYNLPFTVNGKEYIKFAPRNQGLTFVKADLSGDLLYSYSSGNFGVEFETLSVITLNVTSDTTVPADFYAWFTSVFTHGGTPQCDGSACSAEDVNRDNVCDECNLILTFNLRSTLLTYAQKIIDDTLTGGIIPNAQYWLIVSNGSEYYLYLSAKPFYAEDGKLYAGDSPGSYGAIHRSRVYEKDDGSFTSSGWSTQTIGSIDFVKSSVVDSSHGTSFFFQTPLWEEVEELAEKQLQNKTLPSLGGTITILVICGISLVALVVLLVLLSKKFRIFLS